MLNLRCGNVMAFSKQFDVIREAESLRESDGWRTMEVDSVDTDYITLKNIDDRKTSSFQKVKLSDLGASVCDDEMKSVQWRFYDVDLSKEHSQSGIKEDKFQVSPIVPKHSCSTPVESQDWKSKCIIIVSQIVGLFLYLYQHRERTVG